MVPKIVVECGASGIGRLLVDGKDISDAVEAANIRIRGGKPPKVFIRLFGDISVDANGETHYTKRDFQ